MKMIIGKKLAMSQRFRDDGTAVPVTVVEAGPCVVTQVKSADRDGYSAVQLGWGTGKRLTKPQAGHLKGLSPFRILREFRVPEARGFNRGQVLDVRQFQPGDRVKVVGRSKGRGFQGVVKRHHFKGGPASHGHKDNLRMPGSIGATFPQHVTKGTRMAGRMGFTRVSQRHLEIIAVDPTHHHLTVSGAIPGHRNSLVLIESL